MGNISTQKNSPRQLVRRQLKKHSNLHSITYSIYKRYCNLTGFFHTEPDFMIIGCVKCGTTSLYEYLIQHPDVFPPKGKEIDYFDRLYSNGYNWYRCGFPLKFRKYFQENLKNKKFVTGEATPRYIEHPHALSRIKNCLPNTKFIVLLRNPVDRAFSHYKMNLRNDYEYLSFEDAIMREEERTRGRYEKMKNNENYYSWNYDIYAYLKHGIYVERLKKWFKAFPRKQFLIIQSEKFQKYPHKIYGTALEFLDLPKWELQEYKQFRKHHYQKDLKMDPSFRKKLLRYFKPYNEELYQLLGITFNWDQ